MTNHSKAITCNTAAMGVRMALCRPIAKYSVAGMDQYKTPLLYSSVLTYQCCEVDQGEGQPLLTEQVNQVTVGAPQEGKTEEKR